MSGGAWDTDSFKRARKAQQSSTAPVIDSSAFRKGRYACRNGKARSCPYNGPELRDDWFAGFDYEARRIA